MQTQTTDRGLKELGKERSGQEDDRRIKGRINDIPAKTDTGLAHISRYISYFIWCALVSILSDNKRLLRSADNSRGQQPIGMQQRKPGDQSLPRYDKPDNSVKGTYPRWQSLGDLIGVRLAWD